MNVWASASRLASSSKCLRGTGLLISESSAKVLSQIRCVSSATNSPFHEPKKLEVPPLSPKKRRKQRKKGSASHSLASASPGLPTAVQYNASSFQSSLKGKEKPPAKIVVAAAPLLQNWKHNHLLSRSLSPAVVKAKVRKRKVKKSSKAGVSAKASSTGLTYDSQLVPEKWSQEPWDTPKASSKNSNKRNANPESPVVVLESDDKGRNLSARGSSLGEDPRSPPPHVHLGELVREGTIEAKSNILADVEPVNEHLPVDTLAHGLDRVLFNPGVHWLQDPRSRVYNFTPWLQRIPKVNDFAFERLIGFVSSSRDEDLRELARREKRQFAGSTSSMSGMLSHIYFLLSGFKDADLSIMSQEFAHESPSFTTGQKMPSMVVLNHKDGIYAIDSYTPEYDDPDKNVLTWLGTLLENFLTKSPEHFKNFMRLGSAPIEKDEKPLMRAAYRFAKSDKFVMRSQLDCHDPRLPGTGVFDIKTRACVSIRMDLLNYQENAGYLIKNQHGILESFEREYYDLIRSAFLKYSFQVRIANMDGVMVAYHNTERIFGFQYISLDEMDERLFGPVPGIGNKIFNHCVEILEAVLVEATNCFPDQSVLCAFETRVPGKVMEVYVRPMKWEGTEEERPIQQLLLTLEHKVDGMPVRVAQALRTTNEKWTVEFQITRSTLGSEDLQAGLRMLEKRKNRPYVLPSDVPLEEAEEYWRSLNYNTASRLVPDMEDAKAFRPDQFILANDSVERFREVSREGRKFSQEMEKVHAGMPKILLGHGVYEEEEDLFFKEPQHPETSTPSNAATSEETGGEVNATTATSEECLKKNSE
ncbi:hypothetical protein M413DRAFT_444219 [Hebeloma cylindrosporum]|uniref:Pet127-domain-containing protein n=1 Tax=Hebeloma cylindrosporum TaxID=76867 RepID=A0A0C2Y0I9_HEBCY|nr:hypothetical protein M413DRAFT_444219 [Hebeloma cylindrosporum h7]